MQIFLSMLYRQSFDDSGRNSLVWSEIKECTKFYGFLLVYKFVKLSTIIVTLFDL